MQETAYLEGRDDLIAKLKSVPSLMDFEEKYLKSILPLSKIRKYDPEEMIISEGDLDCWIYVILSGEVKIVKGTSEIARLAGAGQIIGEMGVIEAQPRSASVYAAGKTTCLAIDASFMDRLDEADRNAFLADFYRMLAEILSHRLREMNDVLARVMGDLDKIKKSKA
jgi:CRP-like cAMP-binding protein